MCGIAAQYGRPDHDAGRRMLDRLVHRGPDDEGSIAVGDAWLGHRRLSIVDVDGGRQPLGPGSNELWLVGNGEVYNHEAVGGRLEHASFQTSSDNEVALHLVDRCGPDSLHQLNGMFAFVLAGRDGRFLAARDPVGIKPLYWARRGGNVRFASEMAAFDRDWQPFVEVFPPGHYWTPQRGLVRFAAAVPPDGVGGDGSDPAETRDILIRSVERQMMGDVPVGVFLSGGLDSSLVAAIAARYLEERGERLGTFAVGTEGSADVLAARAVASHLGTEHHESVYTADQAVAAVPDVVRAIESFDPSLVRSAVPNHMLARFTSAHVKVVLTGEGADELFAGYEYLCEFEDAESLQAELIRSVEGLHNLNLQRCDRVTMAFGLEARVPFLDREVIEHALRLPADCKLASSGKPEKWLLREAFEGWLPHDFLWRGKSQFGDGSGAAAVLTDAVSATVTEQEFEAERHALDPPLRTREELAYYRIFREHLAGVRAEATVGRFATA
ncbi:MAG TPA: asparagine synthase B [Thermoleophilaceae bacterium]|jgi:asparagine synthase (glutamine-hydrolysing)